MRSRSSRLSRHITASTCGLSARHGWMWMWTSVMRLGERRAADAGWVMGRRSYPMTTAHSTARGERACGAEWAQHEELRGRDRRARRHQAPNVAGVQQGGANLAPLRAGQPTTDRKSTRLNSSHRCISYAVFCLKKK